MRVLSLETSSAIGSVAVVDLDVGATGPWQADVVATSSASVSNAAGESLLALVEGVLRAARTDLGQVDLLAVGVGPGSFTGTRIAVATAKGMAIAKGLPLRGVDAFAALAIDAGTVDERGVDRPVVAAPVVAAPVVAAPVVAAIDARKGEVYLSVVRVVDGDVVTLVEPAHEAPAAAWARIAPALSGGDFVAVGDGIVMVPELARARRRIVGREVPRAAAIGALAAFRHARAPIDEVDVLEPSYVRPPDVTLPTRTPGLPGRPRT